MSEPSAKPAFYVFIDEFGDQSLKPTASPWFILGAVVVSAEREPHLPKWIERIKRPMKGQQRSDLHFYKLKGRMKQRATRFLGKMPVRCFAIASHKENMIGYRNVRCEERYAWRRYTADGSSIAEPRSTPYPNYLTKVLLERVTAWCHRRSMRRFGEPRPVMIFIGKRGGFSVPELKSYFELDRMRCVAGTGVHGRYLAHAMIRPEMIVDASADDVAGLQLADVVAGAFAHALDEERFGGCDRTYAKNLLPRVARSGNKRSPSYFGFTVLPWQEWRAVLSPEQIKTCAMMGYNVKPRREHATDHLLRSRLAGRSVPWHKPPRHQHENRDGRESSLERHAPLCDGDSTASGEEPQGRRATASSF